MIAKNAQIGTIVKSNVPLKCKYFNYPHGENLVSYAKETRFKIVAKAPKVRAIGKGGDFFLTMRPINEKNEFIASHADKFIVNATPDQIEKI